MKLVSMILWILFSTCKSTEDPSVVESIDNLARQPGSQVEPNYCGTIDVEKATRPQWVDDRSIQANDRQTYRTTLATLEAVPITVQRLFFLGGGSIKVVEDGAATCKKVPMSPVESIFASEDTSQPARACWRIIKTEDRLAAVIFVERGFVRHALVRVFAYVFAEMFVEGSEMLPHESRFRSPLRKDLSDFAVHLAALRGAFYLDIERRDEVRRKMLALEQKDPKKFRNFVFAEAVDSYYCESRTRSIFREQFQATWDIFTNPNNISPETRVDFRRRFPKTWDLIRGLEKFEALARQMGPNLVHE